MSFTFKDLEERLGERALKASAERITGAAERLGGTAKVYVSNALKKEITARIPLPKHPAVELCIFIEEPFTRTSIFYESRYEEVERSKFNLPSIFVSLWLEEPEVKRHIGKSLIPHGLGYVETGLSDFATSQLEAYEGARDLAGKFIALL